MQNMLYSKSPDLLYWAAIHRAMSDISKQSLRTVPSTSSSSVQPTLPVICLVLGGGLGRLANFCLDAAVEMKLRTTVHAVDANPIAVKCMREQFCKSVTTNSEVVVHDPFSLYPGMQVNELPPGLQDLAGRCDLVVSELLGCFGDDEFLPELTVTMCNLFLKPGGISIPESWESYVAPVQTFHIDTLLQNAKRSYRSTYTMGLPEDCVFLAEPQLVWKGSCYDYSGSFFGLLEFPLASFVLKTDSRLQKTIPSNLSQSEFLVHGLIGYFKAFLYKDIFVDTRHTSPLRNSFHWECFYLPLETPVRLPVYDDGSGGRGAVRVGIMRHCRQMTGTASDSQQKCLKLHYVWTVRRCGTASTFSSCTMKGHGVYLDYNQ